jgi:hypothetical protein
VALSSIYHETKFLFNFDFSFLHEYFESVSYV